MDNHLYEKLKETALSELTAAQSLDLAAAVRRKIEADTARVIVARRETAVRATRRCPFCGGLHFHSKGRDHRGIQRYRCADCRRTGNALAGTGLARTRHLDKLLPFAELLADRASLDRTAEALGINRKTALRWRRVLLALPAEDQAAGLAGVIEADETFFHDSFKGSRAWKNGAAPTGRMPRYHGAGEASPGSALLVPVLSAIDRTGAKVEGVMPSRSRAAMEAVLNGRIGSGSVVCTDRNRTYKPIVAAAGAEWRPITIPMKKTWVAKARGGKPRRKGRFGLGMINNHHERLKTEINRVFRGVSTRWLPIYLGLLRFVGRARIQA